MPWNDTGAEEEMSYLLLLLSALKQRGKLIYSGFNGLSINHLFTSLISDSDNIPVTCFNFKLPIR